MKKQIILPTCIEGNRGRKEEGRKGGRKRRKKMYVHICVAPTSLRVSARSPPSPQGSQPGPVCPAHFILYHVCSAPSTSGLCTDSHANKAALFHRAFARAVPSTWGALLHPPAVSSLPSPSLLAPSCYMSTCFPVHCLSPHYYGGPMRPVGCFWLVPGCIPSVWNSARHIVDTCEYVRLTGVVTAPSPPFPHLPTRETAGGPAGHRRSDSEGLRTGRVQV